ncbi:glutathione S-transferase family protein [Halioxenophilus aromaticivorans]|uniref:Glutathione S-transferase family protein n=1 Tax=Halioxenophilus aromaticivorans TaxID=1306992 RepID=A0AAV3U2Q3_9ALTE
MKLIIGSKNYSSWSLRPWLLLAHHQIPFEEVRLSLGSAEFKQQLATYSPVGLVPVLQDDDLVIWDSLAICEYVSEHYLNNQGWPASAMVRAQARSASAEMHSGFGAIRSQLPMNSRATGRRVPTDGQLAKDIARIDQLFNRCRQTFCHQGPWLFGQFSIADCFYAPIVVRFRSYGIVLSGDGQIYADWQLQNPALQQWISDAEQEPEIIPGDEVGQT